MQEKNQRRSNKARTEATRKALLKAARKLFVEKGYADTGTPEIVAAAKVTRGALYHHFTDKQDLLRAVLLAEAEKIAEQITTDSQEALNPETALSAGMDAYFEAMKAPGRTRLLLLDGPSVLGPEEMSKINRQAGGNELQEGLEHLFPNNTEVPLLELSELLSAAFDKAALEISQGKPSEQYKRAMRLILNNIEKTER